MSTKNELLARRISQAMQLPAVRGVVTSRLINLVGSLGFFGERAIGIAFAVAEELERVEDPAVSAKTIWKIVTENDESLDLRIEEIVGDLLANRAQIIGHQVDTHLPNHCRPKSGTTKVLDFGAGDGKVTNTLANKLGVKITGIDLEGHAGSGIGTYDGTELPFSIGEFDLAIAICSLHHTEDLPRYLSELYRVTRVGGRLIVIETLPDSLDPQFGCDIAVILDYVASWCLNQCQIDITGNYRGYHEWPQTLLDQGFELIATLADTGYQNPDNMGVDQMLIHIPHGIFIAERRPDPVAN